MSLPVSDAFKTAQEADVNTIMSQVLMVLGDYGNANSTPSVASSSGDFSADYPASGAINGDRTFINIGPASGAENGIGRSSWKSLGVPDAGDDVWLEVDFGMPRTFNRTKVYHLNGNGLREYALAYWNGSAWIGYVGDVVPIGSGGFGDNPFGDAPFGDPVPPGVTPAPTNMKFDTHDHAQITAQKIRIWVGKTEVVNDKANLVAIEFYRVMDITSRVKSVSTSRQRDYKLANNMAATASLTCDNTDRFFSPYYTPTVAEVAVGFVNDELRPNIGIIVKEGFQIGATDELVTTFTGSVDSLRVRSNDREATMDCRDGMKGLFDIVASTKLKQSIDIADVVTYLLQIANVNVNEMLVDTTTIVLDYFFTMEESILTSIQNLVQACGDASFFYDEAGIARFAMYLNSVPQQHTDSTQAQFEAGTVLTNVDTTSQPGTIRKKWNLVNDFSTGLSEGWDIVVDQAPPNNITFSGGKMTIPTAGLGTHHTAVRVLPKAYGTWEWKWKSTQDMWMSFVCMEKGLFGGFQLGRGYSIRSLTVSENSYYLYREDGAGNRVFLASTPGGVVNPALTNTWRVTRDSTGLINVYVNGTLMISVTDNTYTTGAYFGFFTEFGWTHEVDDIYYSNAIVLPAVAVVNSDMVFESAVLDRTAALIANGIFQASHVAAIGGTVNEYTAVSADNITWDAYLVATNGNADPSLMKRYEKWKAVISFLGTGTYIGDDSYLQDVTLNWNTGAGSAKYHTSVDFWIDHETNLLEIEGEVSDNLGGDSCIINSVAVKSTPLVLTGLATDTQWQGTAGTPPAAISITNALSVAAGDYYFNGVIASGMDTSLMSGVSPAAAAVVFGGGATGSWEFSKIHPTKPVLKVTITNPGTITDLRIIGKAFTNTDTPYEATATDSTSIALYGLRSQTIENNYIVNGNIAGLIAARLVGNYASPTTYLPTTTIRPHFSMQLSDRVNVVDDNTGINEDFNVAGVNHVVAASESSLEATTQMVVIKI